MLKRICVLILLATAIVLSQLACRSGEQANAPANASTQANGSNTAAAGATNTATTQDAPTQTANSGATDKSDNSFTELVMLYSQLFTARMKNDKAKVEGLLADDYKETTADGKVLNKAQVLAAIEPDKKFDTYRLDDLKSTANGDTGTVTGHASVTREGKTETWQFTSSFKKEQGHWLAVSTKITDYKKS